MTVRRKGLKGRSEGLFSRLLVFGNWFAATKSALLIGIVWYLIHSDDTSDLFIIILPHSSVNASKRHFDGRVTSIPKEKYGMFGFVLG